VRVATVIAALAISPDPATVAVNGTQQFQVSPPAEMIWGITETTEASPPAFPLKAPPTNTEFLHLTTPGDNGSGVDDWVLIIDSSSPRCGSISSSGLFTASSTVPKGVTCQVTATAQGDPAIIARARLNLR
jgi:hypothetical protein